MDLESDSETWRTDWAGSRGGEVGGGGLGGQVLYTGAGTWGKGHGLGEDGADGNVARLECVVHHVVVSVQHPDTSESTVVRCGEGILSGRLLPMIVTIFIF